MPSFSGSNEAAVNEKYVESGRRLPSEQKSEFFNTTTWSVNAKERVIAPLFFDVL